MAKWWRKLTRKVLEGQSEHPSVTSQTSQRGEEGHKKGEWQLTHWILILAALGLTAMIVPNYFSSQNNVPVHTVSLQQEEVIETLGSSPKEPVTIKDYEEALENQLKDILSKIQGVRDVSVMVNLDSTAETVVEKNIKTQESNTTEQDREGGNRQIEDTLKEEQVVIIRQGNNEEPIVVKTKKPRVRGVLVVASGAENMQVKAWITEAVQRVLDVPANKVSVLPKND
ncbi:stage III sporulation protein AG [Caldalkalibacillus thermarum TA2.A1]|uniref:Stage III sporulation protein AG n=1 Tax=Caldalkalibacillus thermarum (strain TA2.A1) TaxID=986075 RepID=A0A8X8L9I9_CALTT|nr:stage III sporulation protein AG [Caldalkalibacillus thermarum]QZT32649.1 stage III sporulation protein AG [Caldalkalibacillus thermarum TA2.A1]